MRLFPRPRSCGPNRGVTTIGAAGARHRGPRPPGAHPVSTGILPHSLPEWAFRARPGLWRNCLCPKVARIAEQKFGSR